MRPIAGQFPSTLTSVLSAMWLIAGLAMGCGETDKAAEDVTTGPSDTSLADGTAADVKQDVTVAVDAADAGTPTISKGIWSQIKVVGDPNTSLHGLWTDGTTRAVAVGSGGTVLRYDGLAWNTVSKGSYPTLNGVTGSAGGEMAFAVGMGGAIVQAKGQDGAIGTGWGPPGGCSKPADCDDKDPCSADSCEAGVCSHQPSGLTGCCGGAVFADSFDKGMGAWTVVDLKPAPQGGITWQAAAMTGIDGSPRATSAPNAAYFGRTDVPCDGGTGKCPTFDTGKPVGSSMQTGLLQIPVSAKVTLSWKMLIDVGSGYYDQLQVYALPAGGSKELLWDKNSQLSSGTTGGKFQSFSVDLTKYSGKKLTLEIRFDSIDANNNSGEGVFVDDLVLSSTCAPPAVGAKALTTGTLFGVWAANSGDAWTVGEAGFTAHWDGQSWQQVSGGKPRDVTAIAGAGGQALLVGDQGFGAEINGSAIKLTSTGATKILRAVAVTPKADGTGIEHAIAVGTGGLVHAWQGGAWKAELAQGLVGQDMTGVAAFGDGTYAAVTSQGSVYRRTTQNGGTWVASTNLGMPMKAIAATGAASGWAVGMFGAVVERKGEQWTMATLPGGQNANALWVDGPDKGWIVGDNGSAWRRVGGGWQAEQTSTSVHLRAVWASDPENVFAAGLLSTIVRYQAGQWSAMTAPPGIDWNGLWGTSAEDVYAVGGNGAVAHFDGKEWTLLVNPVKETLRAVWGMSGSDVWAVGEKGAIYHSSGAGWTKVAIEPWVFDPEKDPYKVKSTLLSVWGAASNDVWASGEPDQDGHGVVVHWDGATWQFKQLLWDLPRTIRAIWGWNAERVLLAGTQGTVLQLDGKTGALMQLEAGTIATLFAIAPWGKDALLVGDIGTMLRYSPPPVAAK